MINGAKEYLLHGHAKAFDRQRRDREARGRDPHAKIVRCINGLISRNEWKIKKDMKTSYVGQIN